MPINWVFSIVNTRYKLLDCHFVPSILDTLIFTFHKYPMRSISSVYILPMKTQKLRNSESPVTWKPSVAGSPELSLLT
jgi:hypothetical protein